MDEVEYRSTEEADENLFNVIKKEFPNIKENSVNEFNYYILSKTEDDAMKCLELIRQGLTGITNALEEIRIIIKRSSGECIVLVTFMNFPFNLDEIKKCSIFFAEVANKTGSGYDSWEMAIQT